MSLLTATEIDAVPVLGQEVQEAPMGDYDHVFVVALPGCQLPQPAPRRSRTGEQLGHLRGVGAQRVLLVPALGDGREVDALALELGLQLAQLGPDVAWQRGHLLDGRESCDADAGVDGRGE